jgi:serine/threonine-protein kinase
MPSAAQRFEPGERVAGKYRLLRVLATGGMGRVWVARNEATGADVALKVLRRGDAEVDQEARLEERFRQEARLSAMVAHRSIVRVFDLVEEEGALVLVMELLRGETLHAYVQRRGPRPADEAVAILTPVLGALAHAHDRGLVHRDVSPANVFLAVEPDGHVAPKLVDFGIAKSREGASPVQTVTGEVLGTPRYVAPERIRGQEVDGRADLFSAGVVLYEVLTGVSPFAATTASASLAAVLERTVDPDPSIDPRLWLELRRALAKLPYERHATARELATALRDAIGTTDAELEAKLQTVVPVVPPESDEMASGVAVVPATPAPDGSRGKPRARARSVSTWLVSGLALVALLVGALALMRGSRPAASPSSAPPPTAVSAAPAPPPPPPLLPSATTTVAPPASTAAVPPAPPTPRPRPGKPRPVATTPGF